MVKSLWEKVFKASLGIQLLLRNCVSQCIHCLHWSFYWILTLSVWISYYYICQFSLQMDKRSFNVLNLLVQKYTFWRSWLELELHICLNVKLILNAHSISSKWLKSIWNVSGPWSRHRIVINIWITKLQFS